MKTFIDKSINTSVVNEHLKKLAENKCEIHGLCAYRNNEKVLSLIPEPYSDKDTTEVYSLSKMFTSTVAGIARDMGMFSLDDKIVDIFPDKCPENPGENLRAMTVKNVLSMNTGHACCIMNSMHSAEDSVKAFLNHEPEFVPGTHFTYNTGATCLAAALVERVSGEKFFDFACEHLLFPLGITDAYWNSCKDGSCEGGVGLHVSIDDIAKLGLLYFNKGIYKGKRILSEDWIETASSYISDNSGNGDINWCSGYGLQIWINHRQGYRGDGAFGQLCMILPKSETMLAVIAKTSDMGFETECLIDMVEKMYGGDGGQIHSFDYKPLPAGNIESNLFGTYILDDNPIGFKAVNICIKDDVLELTYTDGHGCQKLSAGNGLWIKSRYSAARKIPKLLSIMSDAKKEDIEIASCFETSGGQLRILSRYLNCVHSENTIISVTGNKLSIKFVSDAENRDILSVSEITGRLI